MTTTRVAATIDYLVAAFKASNRLGSADPAVIIYDGPEVSNAASGNELWVGINDPMVENLNAATSNQAWVGLGARNRDENFSIGLVAVSWYGGGVFKIPRDAVYSTMAAVEDLVRADANLGGNVLYVDPGVTQHALKQNMTDRGAIVQVAFRINCKARIGA